MKCLELGSLDSHLKTINQLVRLVSQRTVVIAYQLNLVLIISYTYSLITIIMASLIQYFRRRSDCKATEPRKSYLNKALHGSINSISVTAIAT